MSALPVTYLSPEEYLEIERRAEVKSEYFGGEMFAMAGATEAHNLIAGNLYAALRAALAGRPCRTFVSDMRVRVSATGLFIYPDVVVVCGERRFLDERHDTLLNPTVVFEVLSDSTEAYDRGRKFGQYRTIESLREYVLLAQDEPKIDRFVREDDDAWRYLPVEGNDAAVEIESLGIALRLANLYADVETAG